LDPFLAIQVTESELVPRLLFLFLSCHGLPFLSLPAVASVAPKDIVLLQLFLRRLFPMDAIDPYLHAPVVNPLELLWQEPSVQTHRLTRESCENMEVHQMTQLGDGLRQRSREMILREDTDTELVEIAKELRKSARERVVGKVEELQRVKRAEGGGDGTSDGIVMEVEERQRGEVRDGRIQRSGEFV
jgi:hypothetical protein